MSVTATIIGGKMHLAGNPVKIETESSGAPEGSNNYKILLKVIPVYDMVIQGGPFIDGIAPGSDNKAVFNIQGLVDVPIPMNINFPVENTVTGYVGRTMDIQIQPGESWIDDDDELHEEWGETSDTFFIIKGGVNEKTLAEWNEAGTNFEQQYVTNGKFLTNLPREMKVLPDQFVKLVMLFPRGDAFEAEKTVTAYYSDNSVEFSTVSFTVYTDALYEFDCQPVALGLPVMEETRKLLSYDVVINSENGESEKFTFIIDWQYHEDPLQLFYMTSLGGVDCVALTGNVETGFDSTAIEAVMPLKSTAISKDRTVIVASRTGTMTWKVNTGWKEKETMEAMADLLISKLAWIYYRGKLMPVTITNSGTPLVNKFNNLQSTEISMKLAHNSAYL